MIRGVDGDSVVVNRLCMIILGGVEVDTSGTARGTAATGLGVDVKSIYGEL